MMGKRKGDAMIAVWVEIEVGEAAVADFLPRMRNQARNSLQLEAGCHRFDICVDPDAPNQVALYEVYDDRAAFDAHLQTDHFKDFDARVADMIVAKSLRILDVMD